MNKIRLIGLTGRAGSGKDTAGAWIKQYVWRATMREEHGERVSRWISRHWLQSHEFVKVDSFAEPLRVMALLFGFTREEIYNREFKEAEVAHLRYSPRRFMQALGDVLRGKFGADVLTAMLGRRGCGIERRRSRKGNSLRADGWTRRICRNLSRRGFSRRRRNGWILRICGCGCRVQELNTAWCSAKD